MYSEFRLIKFRQTGEIDFKSMCHGVLPYYHREKRKYSCSCFLSIYVIKHKIKYKVCLKIEIATK